MCMTASFSPGLPRISAPSGGFAAGPAGLPESAGPGVNQGRSSAPRISARQDRAVTSVRNATRRNAPRWKQIEPYTSVPSTMLPGTAPAAGPVNAAGDGTAERSGKNART